MKMIIALLSTLLFVSSVYAADSIHYFDLNNRPAEEVIPLLQPLLQDNEAISGDGYQLFIKTSAARSQEIGELLSKIDKASKTFRISVTNDEFVARNENSIDASIQARSGDTEINVGRYPRREPGVTVSIDTRNVEDKSDKTQFILVQEGKPAFISRERLHIIPIYGYVERPNGEFLIEQDQLYPSKQDGFYVVARGTGANTANINIQSSSSNQRSYQGYGQDQTSIDTSLQVALGRWVEIGGNTDTRQKTSKGLLYRTEKNSTRHKKIFLKIETSN